MPPVKRRIQKVRKMHTRKDLIEEIAAAVHSEDFPRFEKIVAPLIDFTNAGGITPPVVTDPFLAALLEDYIDFDGSSSYAYNDLLANPDEYTFCEFVDRHVTPSPIPDFEEWGWESTGERYGNRRDRQELKLGFFADQREEDLYEEHMELIEELWFKYEEDCREAQQKEWLREIFGEIVKDYKAE